jgi:hypothetical protein
MLGPVMSQTRSFSPRKQSLSTKALPSSSKPNVTVGCLPPTILCSKPRFKPGRTKRCSCARMAKEQAISSSSSTAALRRNFTKFNITCSRSF